MRSSIKGSYTQIKDSTGKPVNRWRIQISEGKDPKTGKYKRYTETFKGSDAQVKRRLKELSDTREKGVQIPKGKLTAGEIFDNWLSGYVKTKCSERTQDYYYSVIEHHLKPAFGQMKIKDLNTQTIQEYEGVICEKLSTRTGLHIHRVLSQSLKYAVRQGYIGQNPCEMVDPPRPPKKSMRTLTPSEAQALLITAKESKYYPLIYAALSTGLRQAELLGLRWRDCDLESFSISVCQTLCKLHGKYSFKEPKTPHSRRRVSMTPKLAEYLREYKMECKLEGTITLDSLVFSKQGKPFDPSMLSHEFHDIAIKAGLGDVRFHDLRHTFASLMLMKGAKPKVISEALGHASVGFTMDVYSHIIEGMQEEAMALLNEVLPAGVLK